MTSFIETPRFPDNISYGATGGPSFKTDVVIVNSGFEQRNQVWAKARASYDVSHAAREATMMESLVAFFRSVRGRAIGFRFKDWQDYSATVTNGKMGTGIGDGTASYQLYKKYEAGSLYEMREIKKPVSGKISLFRGTSPVTLGAGAGNAAIDYTTGIVTFVADISKSINSNVTQNITAITKANPAQVTTDVAHGFNNGDKVYIAGVGGMTQVNSLYFTVTVVDPTNFTIGVNSSAYTDFTTGGTAKLYGLTKTNPVQAHVTGHGLSNNDVVYISGVSGMTQVNGLTFTVKNKTADRFELYQIDGTSYTAYTSGGTVKKYPQSTENLTWSGEFDIPVRFDTDKINVSIIAPDIQGWDSIPLVEVRV